MTDLSGEQKRGPAPQRPAGSPRRSGSHGPASLEGDDFDPIRVLARVGAPVCRQRAGFTIDTILGQMVRQLSDCEQILARCVDTEAARLPFRRPGADTLQL